MNTPTCLAPTLPHPFFLYPPGQWRGIMEEGLTAVEDPHRDKRLAIAIPSALLLGLSGFFAATIALHGDGSHGPVLAIDGVRTLVLAVAALLIVYMAARPMKPDPRIAQAVMLAGAILGIVLGLEGIITTYGMDTFAPGAAPYMQLVAAAGFLTLRWRRSLWPTSRWLIEAREAAAKRTTSKRAR